MLLLVLGSGRAGAPAEAAPATDRDKGLMDRSGGRRIGGGRSGCKGLAIQRAGSAPAPRRGSLRPSEPYWHRGAQPSPGVSVALGPSVTVTWVDLQARG